MASAHVKRVIDYLWWSDEGQEPPRVYALLDAARDESIYPKIVDSGVESTCLYRGEKARTLAWVAPYLVELHPEDPFTEWLLENGWGKCWGVFVGSAATLSELKRHFRAFLMVYDEGNNPLYFRYYDPRVLRVYLPTCNAEELAIVFGPVNSYVLEDDDGTALLDFSVVGKKIHRDRLTLTGEYGGRTRGGKR
ncbi:MAG: DUF4123 domain-containing protein [bacterium]|nr:DUF4123 domain-containing protein [bacterium]